MNVRSRMAVMVCILTPVSLAGFLRWYLYTHFPMFCAYRPGTRVRKGSGAPVYLASLVHVASFIVYASDGSYEELEPFC
jgi:hypothetical protein